MKIQKNDSRRKAWTKTSKVIMSALLIASALGVSSASAANNIISNGGFEGSYAGGTGANWSFGTVGGNTPQEVQASVVEMGAFEGDRAQLLGQGTASVAGDNLRIISESYSVLQGYGLTLTFQSNIVEMTNASLEHTFVFFDKDGKFLSDVKGTPATTVTGGYKETLLKVSPPKEAASFQVRFDSIVSANGGSYRLYIDNVEVTSAPNSAPITDQTQVGVIGGDLEFYTSSGAFTDVELDYNKTMLTQVSSNANVTDNTGEGLGWSLKVSSTDFLSQSLSDASGNGTKVVLKLPAASVVLAPKAITHVSGQTIDAVNGPIAKNITLASQSQVIMSAAPGYGAGSYSVPLEYRLTIPKTLEVVSVEGTGSGLSVGQFVGTRAGTYKATLDFIIGTGL